MFSVLAAAGKIIYDNNKVASVHRQSLLENELRRQREERLRQDEVKRKQELFETERAVCEKIYAEQREINKRLCELGSAIRADMLRSVRTGTKQTVPSEAEEQEMAELRKRLDELHEQWKQSMDRKYETPR
jgi:hypothetical protein